MLPSFGAPSLRHPENPPGHVCTSGGLFAHQKSGQDQWSKFPKEHAEVRRGPGGDTWPVSFSPGITIAGPGLPSSFWGQHLWTLISFPCHLLKSLSDLVQQSLTPQVHRETPPRLPSCLCFPSAPGSERRPGTGSQRVSRPRGSGFESGTSSAMRRCAHIT